MAVSSSPHQKATAGKAGARGAAATGRGGGWVTIWAVFMTAVNVGLVVVMSRLESGGCAVDLFSAVHRSLLESPALAALGLAPETTGNATRGAAATRSCPKCSSPKCPAPKCPAPNCPSPKCLTPKCPAPKCATPKCPTPKCPITKCATPKCPTPKCSCPDCPELKPPPPCKCPQAPSCKSTGGLTPPLTLSQALHATPQCTKAAYETTGNNSAWYSLKGIPPPAECRVQGFVIEELEPEYNFRRPYTLRLAEDPEDKTHLLPYLRAFQDTTMATRRRRVLLDLGGNFFQTSVLWFLRNYPLDFTEIHVFESVHGRFRKPPPGKPIPNLVRGINKRSRATTLALQVPKWALDRIHVHEMLVGTQDRKAEKGQVASINITRFVRDVLKLTRDDTVVVKMDIEKSEWAVLPEWLADKEMPFIVDELFVEVHYRHFSMFGFGWTTGHFRHQALWLLEKMRKQGFFVHPWP